MKVLFIEDKTWQAEGATKNFLHLWAPKAVFFFSRWQQLSPRTPKEQITTTHYSETTPEHWAVQWRTYSFGEHACRHGSHTDHTQTALFLDQKERLNGRWSPLNCEKQFGGDTSLRLLIIERFTAAIGLIHRKDWRAAVCRQRFTSNTSEPYRSH